MTKSTNEEKLERLKKKKAKITDEERKIKSSISKDTRKKDTRRKIILGGELIKIMEQDETLRNRVAERLDKNIEKASDRELFNLSPLTEGQ